MSTAIRDDRPPSSDSAIFISYRRGPDSGYAHAIYTKLIEIYGGDRIFFDVDAIALGDDFVDVLDKKLSASEIVLVIIGPQWANASNDIGSPRLHSEGDFVRLEVRAAINQGKKIIPILVNGASMPQADELPEDIKTIVRRNALELGHTRLTSSLNDMAHQIAQLMPPTDLAAKGKSSLTSKINRKSSADLRNVPKPTFFEVLFTPAAACYLITPIFVLAVLNFAYPSTWDTFYPYKLVATVLVAALVPVLLWERSTLNPLIRLKRIGIDIAGGLVTLLSLAVIWYAR